MFFFGFLRGQSPEHPRLLDEATSSGVLASTAERVLMSALEQTPDVKAFVPNPDMRFGDHNYRGDIIVRWAADPALETVVEIKSGLSLRAYSVRNSLKAVERAVTATGRKFVVVSTEDLVDPMRAVERIRAETFPGSAVADGSGQSALDALPRRTSS